MRSTCIFLFYNFNLQCTHYVWGSGNTCTLNSISAAHSFNVSQFIADDNYFIHYYFKTIQFCLDSAFVIGVNISENCSKLLESGVANISTDEELLCNACIRKMTHQHSAKHEASAFNIVCFISDIREVCYTSIGLVILATGAFGCNKII